MENTSPASRPGRIINVQSARSMMQEYVKRMQATKEIFDGLPEDQSRPFDPTAEALGWVFHKDVIADVLNRLGAGDDYVVIAFGVTHRDHNDNGEPDHRSPCVLHCLVTPARKTGDAYQISKLAPALTGDDEFGAEQGNTCCHAGLFDCAESLLSNGGFFDMNP